MPPGKNNRRDPSPKYTFRYTPHLQHLRLLQQPLPLIRLFLLLYPLDYPVGPFLVAGGGADDLQEQISPGEESETGDPEFSRIGLLVLTITAKPSNPHEGTPPARRAAVLPQARHTPLDWPISR